LLDHFLSAARKRHVAGLGGGRFAPARFIHLKRKTAYFTNEKIPLFHIAAIGHFTPPLRFGWAEKIDSGPQNIPCTGGSKRAVKSFRRV
jgi:hypothetical protein